MGTLEKLISRKTKAHLKEVFELEVEKLEFQLTRKDFDGDITLILFPLLKLTKQKSSFLGETIGRSLVQNTPLFPNSMW